MAVFKVSITYRIKFILCVLCNLTFSFFCQVLSVSSGADIANEQADSSKETTAPFPPIYDM